MLAANTGSSIRVEPAPPAEGPEDIPAEGPIDPNRNPGLLPTPLLRGNAAVRSLIIRCRLWPEALERPGQSANLRLFVRSRDRDP